MITGETGAELVYYLGCYRFTIGATCRNEVYSMRASKCVIEACFGISAYGMQPFLKKRMNCNFEDESVFFAVRYLLRVKVEGLSMTRRLRLYR